MKLSWGEPLSRAEMTVKVPTIEGTPVLKQGNMAVNACTSSFLCMY